MWSSSTQVQRSNDRPRAESATIVGDRPPAGLVRWVRARYRLPVVGVFLAVLVAGCGTQATPETAPLAPPASVPVPGGGGVARALPAQTGCATTIRDNGAAMVQALAHAAPGQRICLTGYMGTTALELDRSGTVGAPIDVLGDGAVTVANIIVRADNVIVEGVNAQYSPSQTTETADPEVAGISVTGNNVDIRNDTWTSSPGWAAPGIEFWGSHINIQHNTLLEQVSPYSSSSACMETSANVAGKPATAHVVIDSNRCDETGGTCLTAYGPAQGPPGTGVDPISDIAYTNNYCNSQGDPAILLNNAQNSTIIGNRFVGPFINAISLQNNSTGAHVNNNNMPGSVMRAVDLNSSSATNYQGPQAP